jgi:hypothetical protein
MCDKVAHSTPGRLRRLGQEPVHLRDQPAPPPPGTKRLVELWLYPATATLFRCQQGSVSGRTGGPTASSGISSYLGAVAAAASGGRVGPGGRDRTGQGGGSSSSSCCLLLGRRWLRASRALRPRRAYGKRGQHCWSFSRALSTSSRDFRASRISLTWTTAPLSSIREEGESCRARLSEAQDAKISRFSVMVRSGSSTTCRRSVQMVSASRPPGGCPMSGPQLTESRRFPDP